MYTANIQYYNTYVGRGRDPGRTLAARLGLAGRLPLPASPGCQPLPLLPICKPVSPFLLPLLFLHFFLSLSLYLILFLPLSLSLPSFSSRRSLPHLRRARSLRSEINARNIAPLPGAVLRIQSSNKGFSIFGKFRRTFESLHKMNSSEICACLWPACFVFSSEEEPRYRVTR